MLRRVLIVLLVIPLVDALFLVYVASLIGAVPTVALVVLTALIGLLLVRAEGRHTLRRLQEQLATGEVPTDSILDGGLLIAAGAFLLTPGLVTDAIGFLLVLPPSRFVIRTIVKRWVVVPVLDRKTDGLVTGNIYTVGFGEADTSPGDAVDLGTDAYHIDVEDEEGKGNA